VRFTLRQLEYFVAACEAGSVTLAAERIPVSQSSVSAAVAQLEAALEVQLLIRHHAQGVSPTPAGRRFLPRARALLREAGELERFSSELTEELRGPLDLGVLVTIAPIIAPRLCQEFQRRHPAVELRLAEEGQDELLAGLRHGLLSLALTYDLELGDNIAFDPLAELPPYAIFASGHPLARRREVGVGELAEHPLILLDLPLSRQYFESLFAAEGRRPLVRHRSAHLDVIRTLVANGYGYSLVNARPRLDRALDGRRLRSVPLAGQPRALVLGIGALAGSRPTRAAEAFRDHCRGLVAGGDLPGLAVDGR
jgi:DNA-binding transcriptional LysR family regulator